MKNSSRVEISIVIGFKDWGLDRLLGSIESIKQSLQQVPSEIIISDYGSEQPEGYKEAIEALGAVYVYTETDKVWSRSRALNVGLSVAQGRFLITTDADMVFSPKALQRIFGMLDADPNAAYILQCRDLPVGISHADVNDGLISWEEIDSRSRLRPRWGMGGLIAFHRSAYEELRGLDERMQIYGGEDIDLAKRLLRIGRKRIWISDADVRMYHIWHESSRDTAQVTEAGALAIKLNRDIQLSDQTQVRNIQEWAGRPAALAPLVTVAISTYNRAEYLPVAVESVLAQTFTDWELIIVNDGSTDNTSEVLSSFKDSRIRVIDQENRGLAAARNLITSEAQGKYIAVHDDDDIMLPWRLEASLKAISGGALGSTGGWVDFDNKTGERSYHSGKKFSAESMLFNGGVYLHPTLFVERKVLEAIPYNESMRSGSDYNLGVRMARAGVKLNHAGEYLMLRRLHEGQITNLDSSFQKTAAVLTSVYARSAMHPSDVTNLRKGRLEKDRIDGMERESVDWQITGFLPDHLVRRRADIEVSLDGKGRDSEPTIAGIQPTLLVHHVDRQEVSGVWNIKDLNLVEYLRGFRTYFSDSHIRTQMVEWDGEVSTFPESDLVEFIPRWQELVFDKVHDYVNTSSGVFYIGVFLGKIDEKELLSESGGAKFVLQIDSEDSSGNYLQTLVIQVSSLSEAAHLEKYIRTKPELGLTNSSVALRLK